jgi:hypothetical protein
MFPADSVHRHTKVAKSTATKKETQSLHSTVFQALNYLRTATTGTTSYLFPWAYNRRAVLKVWTYGLPATDKKTHEINN